MTGQGIPLVLEEGNERSGAIAMMRNKAGHPFLIRLAGGKVSPTTWPEVKRPHIQEDTDKRVDYLRGLKD